LADASRARLVLALDCLIAFLVVVAIAIELTGGIYTSVAGVRVSMRSVDRAALAALLLLVVRRFAGPGVRPFRMSEERFAALRDRVFDRQADGAVPGRRLRMALAVAGICAVGAVLLFPQLRQMGSVPDLGDPLFSIWRMGWAFQQLQGDPRALFDANIFHPDPLTLTYSDAMLLTSLMAAPLLALHVHPVVVYNIVFLSGFLLSGVAVYGLVARLTGSSRAGFVSGLIFGFHPFRFEHYSHLELQMTFWMPIALFAVHRFVETARFRYAAAAALALAAQLYASMYYGFFLGIFLLVVGFVLQRYSTHRGKVMLRGAAIAGLLAILVAVPLARPYLAARAIKGDRGHDAVRMFSATPTDYLRAHTRSVLYGPRLLPGRQIERALFPGVLPIVLAIVALAPPIGPIRLAYLTGLLVAFDGSLGFNGLLYPYLYEWVPPVRGMRVPARFSIVVGLSLAVLAGFGMRRVLQRRGAASAWAVTSVVVAASMVDVWPRLELRPVWRDPPAVYAAVADQPAVLAEFPLNSDPASFADNTAFMYFSLWHWRDMVNGYSGFLPPGYELLVEQMHRFPDREAIEFLRSRGATHVSVNCSFYRGPCGAVLERLDALPSLRLVNEARWEGDLVRLYALLP
jgi:hypothetical protein